jgi:hypothetical protein
MSDEENRGQDPDEQPKKRDANDILREEGPEGIKRARANAQKWDANDTLREEGPDALKRRGENARRFTERDKPAPNAARSTRLTVDTTQYNGNGSAARAPRQGSGPVTIEDFYG